jgi:hypothetical protein
MIPTSLGRARSFPRRSYGRPPDANERPQPTMNGRSGSRPMDPCRPGRDQREASRRITMRDSRVRRVPSVALKSVGEGE